MMFNELQIRKNTFSKFGFKMNEKEENVYLKTVLKEF
jgi:hypothetical protein